MPNPRWHPSRKRSGVIGSKRYWGTVDLERCTWDDAPKATRPVYAAPNWKTYTRAGNTLAIPAQELATPERDAFGEAFCCSPRHAQPEPRPLGGINRGRRPVYAMSAQMRGATPKD